MKDLLLYMAKSLVDNPDSVTVTEVEGETTVAELQYQIDHSEDDDMIESVAREKLGLVKPGEKIFYDTSD